ncbi:MAG: Serine/threonine protein kinase PrkC, regulator of stationary phase [Deltaproteobacteria bacterium]|nr:Serine/threonine protein kinase PrkC, regulator of stationary phase [Deltaproteobacteria bacterium]
MRHVKRSGSSGDDTLGTETGVHTVEPPRSSPASPASERTGAASASLRHYALGEVIGQGGMGEVALAHHRVIGRDVAIKRLKSKHPADDEIARFMREARIQARLDHPAIVPVHEVGHDEEGRPFFTMRRLAGVTLAKLLVTAPPLPHRLLRAFAEISLAIDFAHSRGIIHRDLKPSNIMLGDFGEVYVIDWGLARVAGDVTAERGLDTLDDLGGATGDGAMLGTPGYMSPEQMHDAATVDRPTDVYALGAILFEILAGEPLHPRGVGAVASTLNELDCSPTRRRPDRKIPPELDTLCVEALARKPAARPTARIVAEAVQRYLDGDRDVAQRRAMSADQLALARTALGGDRRSDAMRAASRALALDPESAGAAELVTSLMLQPPREPPPELEAEYRADDARNTRRHARVSAAAFLVVPALVAALAWVGVRSWGVLGAIMVLAIPLMATAWWVGRRETRPIVLWGYAAGHVVLIALVARASGPFLVAPGFACAVMMSMMSYPVFVGRRWTMVGMMMAGWLVPMALETLHVVAPTWQVVDGAFVITSQTLEFSASATVPLVLIMTLLTAPVAGVLAGHLFGAQQRAQRQLHAQAWHLRQLLPSDRK